MGGLKRLRKGRSVEEFHALKGVSFSVPHGQTLAIIGWNGSGKSTLLSILARVYKPSSGCATLFSPMGGRARLAPLLALGAGFHPELNGLENIHFYGSLLGLSRRDLEEKEEAIVAFAELGNKIDTEMHSWNDGAKLRLGFAIAIHTDPDIVLVDEVLAVGDEAFQNKCYRKIGEMQEAGKTIVFVSHDLVVVERVANRVIWLNQGLIEQDGTVEEVLPLYREAAQKRLEEG
jgi:ABC-type polysaccharide/polyol phosphate transport system ATPase subunit